jgi:hypothetical protein
LHGELGSPEFCAQYMAARFGRPAPVEAKAPALPHHDPDSLAWLVDQWMSSAAWASTAPETQKNRRNIMARITHKFGAKPYRAITRQHIELTQTDLATNNGKSMAVAFVKTLRVFFAWAVECGLMEVNIARDVKLVSPDNKEGFHAWTDADRKAFEATHALGTSGRVFYEVLRGTGARLGDAVLLGNGAVTDGIVTFQPLKTARKTGTIVSNPMEPALKAALAAGPVGQTTWIAGAKGQKLSKGYAGLWFRQLCDEAGLKHCSAHGVRKGEAGADAESGVTVDELKARYGWTENRTPGIYTAQAERKALSINAAQKRLAKGKPRLTLVA